MSGVESKAAGATEARWRSTLAALSMTLLGVVAAGEAGAAQDVKSLEARVRALEARLQKTEDIEAIEKLTRAYGYYVDKAQWDQIVDLFAAESRVEIAGRGVYYNTSGVDTIFRKVMGRGKIGLSDGALFNHMILQGITDVDADGKTARGRWRAFVQIGQYQKAALWSEGTYENIYVKENGVWKFKDLHFFATYYTPYADGWSKTALPNNGPSTEFPPDKPQSVKYDVFPGHFIPPYHYPNPVTGKPWVAPAPEAAAATSEEKK
jgi:hypothetical protein